MPVQGAQSVGGIKWKQVVAPPNSQSERDEIPEVEFEEKKELKPDVSITSMTGRNTSFYSDSFSNLWKKKLNRSA